jgi:hypothetical protein
VTRQHSVRGERKKATEIRATKEIGTYIREREKGRREGVGGKAPQRKRGEEERDRKQLQQR